MTESLGFLNRNSRNSKPYFTRNTLELLFNHLDLSQEYVRYPADRKRIIEPVLEELQGKPLSTGILTHCSVANTKDGKDYKLVCRKKGIEMLPKEYPIKEEDWTSLSLDELLKRMRQGADS